MGKSTILAIFLAASLLLCACGGPESSLRTEPVEQAAVLGGSFDSLIFPDAERLGSGTFNNELAGSEYNPGLPSNRFTTDWPRGVYSPAVSGGGLPDYAYACYTFAVGEDPISTADITLEWTSLPGEESPLWLGLANWELERWEFFPLPDKQHLNIDDFPPYRNELNVLVVLVVAGGNDVLNLNSVTTSYEVNFLPEAELQLSPDSGEAPFEVTLDGSGSTDSDGSIVLYEFDSNDDGLYEQSSPEPQYTFVFNEEQMERRRLVKMRMRITDDRGGAAETFKMLEVLNPEYGPVIIDSSCIPGADKELLIIDGMPAVAYIDIAVSSLNYARASTASGVGEWELKPLDYFPGPSYSPGAGIWLSMAVIDGRPAIAWCRRNDDLQFDLAYQISNNADGSGSWSETIVETAQERMTGIYLSLGEFAGQPLIAYGRELPSDPFGTYSLRIASTNSNDGLSGWSFSDVLDDESQEVFEAYCVDMHDFGSYLGLSYIGSDDTLCFASSTTPSEGDSWQTKQIGGVSFDIASFQTTSLQEIGGQPAIAYGYMSQLAYARPAGTDMDGDWNHNVWIPGILSACPNLFEEAGLPVIYSTASSVISYQGSTLGGLEDDDWTMTSGKDFQIDGFSSYCMVQGMPGFVAGRGWSDGNPNDASLIYGLADYLMDE